VWFGTRKSRDPYGVLCSEKHNRAGLAGASRCRVSTATLRELVTSCQLLRYSQGLGLAGAGAALGEPLDAGGGGVLGAAVVTVTVV
jgi:hypothetical protein